MRISLWRICVNFDDFSFLSVSISSIQPFVVRLFLWQIIALDFKINISSNSPICYLLLLVAQELILIALYIFLLINCNSVDKGL